MGKLCLSLAIFKLTEVHRSDIAAQARETFRGFFFSLSVLLVRTLEEEKMI